MKQILPVTLLLALLLILGACRQAREIPPARTLEAESAEELSARPAVGSTVGREEPARNPEPETLQLLVAGEVSLPAAEAFGEPGFHEVLEITEALPDDLGPTAGRRIVLALRDAGRPKQTCSREHPLSGCATVDWSDAEGRPRVPPGGVFDNRLTLLLESGERSFFLTESGTLSDVPDPFRPG